VEHAAEISFLFPNLSKEKEKLLLDGKRIRRLQALLGNRFYRALNVVRKGGA
jgi:hypothetical protein